ncbi:MAG TPA: hypothetical protein VLW53_22410, partial [Candidatus Eisenbacteria bacterium]|nr:hypothetical protein [Candidatus Eisenbacteria bacterium]
GPSRRQLELEAVATSADGSWVASTGPDGTVRLSSTVDGSHRAALPVQAERDGALAVAPGGAWLAVGARDGSVRLWNTADRSLQATVRAHPARVRRLAVGPGGSWFASAGDDGAVRLWSSADGSLLSTLPGYVLAHDLTISPDGAWIACASTVHVRVWSRDRPSHSTAVLVEGYLHGCSWFPAVTANPRLALAGTGGLYVLELLNWRV